MKIAAGTGITHSEFNPSRSNATHFYQIWLLPVREGIAPSYEQKRFAPEARQNQWQLVASRAGVAGSLVIHQDANVYLADLTAGEELYQAIPRGRHQPQMTFGVASGIDRQQLVNNVLLLAKGAKEFGVPTILTTVETESFSGPMWPELLDVFPKQTPIERTGMNSWDTPAFREAIKATGKKNIIMSGLWTEVCIAWPTLNMIAEGYNIFVVEDACGGTSAAAHDAALSRMVQAGHGGRFTT